jgi:hypothetical protein
MIRFGVQCGYGSSMYNCFSGPQSVPQGNFLESLKMISSSLNWDAKRKTAKHEAQLTNSAICFEMVS